MAFQVKRHHRARSLSNRLILISFMAIGTASASAALSPQLMVDNAVVQSANISAVALSSSELMKLIVSSAFVCAGLVLIAQIIAFFVRPWIEAFADWSIQRGIKAGLLPPLPKFECCCGRCDANGKALADRACK